MKHQSKLLFFVFISICFQLFSMKDGEKPKKPGKVIHLSELESKAKAEVKAAEETWNKLPQSWRASAKEAAQKVDQTNARHKKLQEINAHQNAKLSPAKSNVIYLSELQKKAEQKVKAKQARKNIPQPRFPDYSAPEANMTSEELAEESRYNKLKEINKHQNAQQKVPQPPSAPQKSTPLRSPVGGAFGLASRIAEANAVPPNETFDSFVSGLANVSANFAITVALGTPASIALGACSAAKPIKEEFNKVNTKNNSNPFTDAFCNMNLGCSYQESVEGLKVVLSAAEKLDTAKRKAIEAHEENLKAFVGCVYEGYKSARENYPDLFKTKVKKEKKSGDADKPQIHGIVDALKNLEPKKTEEDPKKRRIANIPPFAYEGEEARQEFLEQKKELEKRHEEALREEVWNRHAGDLDFYPLGFACSQEERRAKHERKTYGQSENSSQLSPEFIYDFRKQIHEPTLSVSEYVEEELREYMLEQSLQGYTSQQKRLEGSIEEGLHNSQPTLFKCNQEYSLSVPEDIKATSASSKSKRTKNTQQKKAVAQKNVTGNEKGTANTPQKLTPEMLAGYIKAEQKKLDALAKKEFESEMEYREAMSNIAGGFNGVAAIARIFGHKKEAHAIATFGYAGIEAADGIRTIVQAGLTGASIHPYVGIVMAVASMVSLFLEDDEGDNSTQIILDAIKQGIMHLSEQIHNLHEDMREQFAEVHKKLNRHHLIVLEKFFALHLDQENILHNLKDLHKYIEANHRAIQDGIDALHSRVDSNFRMTISNLNGLRIEKIDKLKERSLLILQREDASPEEFNNCKEDLYIKGKSLASSAALTGDSVDIHSPTALQTTLEGSAGQQNIFAHPAFSNINLLSRYLEANFNDFKHEKLVNPLIWIKCVEALLYLIGQKLNHDEEYPPSENTRNLDIEKLLVLKGQGEKIGAFIKTIGQNGYVEKIAHKHRNALRQFSKAVKQEQASFEEKAAQRLRKEQSAYIESEKLKTRRIVTLYECKKCVEHIRNAVNTSGPIRYWNSIFPYALCTTYFRGQPKTDIIRESSVEQVPDPAKRFNQLFDNYLKNMAENEKVLQSETALNLAQESFDPVGNGMSRWIYPEDPESTMPTLMLPTEDFPLDPAYVIAENKGIGTITHEYSIVDRHTVYRSDRFQIQSYFTFKHDNQTIKILDLYRLIRGSLNRANYKLDTLYSLSENILHYWYGGRYPQGCDTYVSVPGGAGGMMAVMQARDAASFSGYYPPSIAYLAERDTFVSNAKRGPDQSEEFLPFVQQLIQEDQEEKRLEFNQEVMTHISSKSATSDIFKAAQKLDVGFKILDSLLTLMYHDCMGDSEFAVLKSNEDEHCIKDLATVTKYLQNYSSKHNPEHEQGNYLPFYIQSTIDKLRRAVGEITNADYEPQFNAVTRFINNIDRLVRDYRERIITPRTIALKPSHEESEALAIVSKQNEALKKSNRKLASEVKAVKQEMMGVKDQLQKMMDLMLEMKKRM